MKKAHLTVMVGLLCSSMLQSNFAMAADDEAVLTQLKAMQQQINSLQGQVGTLQKELKKAKQQQANASSSGTVAIGKTANVDTASAASLDPSAGGTKTAAKTESQTGVIVTNKNNIKLTLGGFIEAAGISRSKTESTDLASNFSTGIPFPYQPGNHLSEFRESARQSRLSLLAEGRVDPDTNLAAYFEGDFLGAAVSANSTETNSYNPRMRQAYATLDRTDLGVHVLGGQAWSLITLDKQGITPRQENIPATIDAQYVPGFTFTRNTQLRLTKDFDDQKLWAAVSVESPQAIINNSTPNAYTGSPVFTLNGTGTLNTTAYSLDLAPDVIAKVAYDPGYGHYEVYGLARFFRDRNNSANSTIMGGGAGAAAILPIISKKLDFQLSGLAGPGVGRYGASQLPDVTLKPNGGLATVDSAQLLAGLTAHPDEQWDVYLYSGVEGARKKTFTTTNGTLGYGYGSPLYNNSGCNSVAGSAATCVANTKEVAQLTGGAWWKFYKGSFGMMEAGAQDSFTKRYTFSGIGGSPSANENVTMVSLRYYPF